MSKEIRVEVAGMEMSLEEFLAILDNDDNAIPGLTKRLEQANSQTSGLTFTIAELMDLSIALGHYLVSDAYVDAMGANYFPVLMKLKKKLDDDITSVLKDHGIEC